MRLRRPEAWPCAAIVLVAVLALTACQPLVDVSRAKVDRALPRAQEVEIPLVTDENEQPIGPDAIKGKQVFEANCAVCHGKEGAGDGPDATWLGPKMGSFRDRAMVADVRATSAAHVLKDLGFLE